MAGFKFNPVTCNLDLVGSGGGSGANTALSNLVSTSINQALNPSTNHSRDMGDGTVSWRDIFARSINLTGTGQERGHFKLGGSPTFQGAGLGANVIQVTNIGGSNGFAVVLGSDMGGGTGGTTGATYIRTGDFDDNSNVGTTGAINIGTGTTVGGSSGNIAIKTGTAGLTRGKIQLVNGSEGTAGHVWTSTDTLGAGEWSAVNPFSTETTDFFGSVSAVSTTTNSANNQPYLFFGSEDTAIDATFTNHVTLSTGSQTSATSSAKVGDLYITPGYNYGTGNSGNTSIFAGDADQSGTPGTLALGSGTAYGSGAGGDVNVATGGTGLATKGKINLQAMTVFQSYTTAERDTLVPVAGSFIRNSTLNKLQWYNGAAWETITSV